MTDTDTKARRSVGRKLRHRAALLRKIGDELDALAAAIEGAAEREPEGDGDETT